MIYKYFAYKDRDRWKVNDLLSIDQCRAMLNTLNWKHEVFASIQDYDEFGNVVACPIYFDLDHPEIEVATKDCRHLVAALEFLVNCTPRIYFSGNKGYHLIIERKIVHPRCHEMAKDFALETAAGVPSVDWGVYGTRRMFRIPGSPASKPGAFKTELTRGELFDLYPHEIPQLAKTQRFIPSGHDPSKMDDAQIEAWLAIAEKKLPIYTNIDQVAGAAKDVDLEITPCLRTLLHTPPPPGERNSTAFLLARFFKQCGIDESSCRTLLLSHAHWKTFNSENREVETVVRSTYRSRSQPHLGCKGKSIGADLMRGYCDQLCPIRDDFPMHSPIDTKRSYDR